VSPTPNNFNLSNQVSPYPNNYNSSISEINNILRSDKKSKKSDKQISTETLKEKIKPSKKFMRFGGIVKPDLPFTKDLTKDKINNGLANLQKSQENELYFRNRNPSFGLKIGSVQSFDFQYGSSQNNINTPGRNYNQKKTNNEPQIASLEKEEKDEKSQKEDIFVKNLDYHISRDYLSTIFKKKNLTKEANNIFKSQNLEEVEISDKIKNTNQVQMNNDSTQNMLICPTPIKTNTLKIKNVTNKIIIENKFDCNGTNMNNSKAFRDLIDFDNQNKIKVKMHKEILRLLKLDLSKEKICELLEGAGQHFADLTPNLSQYEIQKKFQKMNDIKKPLLKKRDKPDSDGGSRPRAKGIFLEEISPNYLASSQRVKYLTYLDESMYRGPREYKKQSNREKKSFKVKKFNFFWHYNPDLFEVGKKKKKKTNSQKGGSNYDPYYSKMYAKAQQIKDPVYMIESPKDSFSSSNLIHLSSNEIRSKRIKNRLKKNAMEQEKRIEPSIDIDFTDDRLIISEAVRKPRNKKIHNQYAKYINDLTFDNSSDKLEVLGEMSYLNKIKNKSISNSPEEQKTSKKNKNMFVTPQMFPLNAKSKTELEDQRETVKKGHILYSEMLTSSPNRKVQKGFDSMKSSAIFDSKSPINLKIGQSGNNFMQVRESVPYETPRNEFGVKKSLLENMENYENAFLKKKESVRVEKTLNFAESKLQNLKTTSKKYNSKNFSFLNGVNPKSPSTPYKVLVPNTPENGLPKISHDLLEKNMDVLGMNPKDFDDFQINSKSNFIDTSIKKMKQMSLAEKINNSNQISKDFADKNDQSFSKLAEFGNLFSLKPKLESLKTEDNKPNQVKIETPVQNKINVTIQETPKSLKKISSQKGCFCKNTECLKNYCSCFKMGQMCLSTCECKNCENHENSQRRDEKIKSIALKSQTSSDRKKDRKNRRQEMRELFNHKINESLRMTSQEFLEGFHKKKQLFPNCKFDGIF
jgi:hypothetical protein